MADSRNMQAVISDGHREVQRQLTQDEDYNTASKQYAELVAAVIAECGADKILDYGSGSGGLAQNLGKYLSDAVEVTEYDPAVEGKDTTPEPCMMVACLDVLPFVEENRLDAVLDDIARVTDRILFVTIPTVKGRVFAEDGSPAQKIVRDVDWWMRRLLKKFDVHSLARSPEGFWAILKKKG